MGTNYYLHEKPDCECCGRSYEPLHIGKSSGGWCFSLHVMPEDNINTIDDWRTLWSKDGVFIRNEYGEKVPIEEMEQIITDRLWRGEFPRRHEIDGRICVGYGAGTWDYLTGSFC
jgi:hypothetical protein